MRTETIKLSLKKKTGKNLHDFDFGYDTNSTNTKAKINKCNDSKLKTRENDQNNVKASYGTG
jgi:hypothetical protein